MALGNPSSNRQTTLWAQIQTGGPRIIPNTSGAWNGGTARKLRFDSGLSITPVNALNTPTYKTGNRSPMQGVRGRQGVNWTIPKPFIPSGAAGTVPDDDPLLQAIFGATAVVVASTSVTYNLGEALYYLFLSRYNKTPGLTAPTNAYVLGGVPTMAKFTGGPNFLAYSIQGAGVGSGDSVNFSSYTGADAILKGALTTYPAEPGSATQNGNVIPGFAQGAGFAFGGSSVGEIRSTVEISMDLGIDVIADGLSDAYPIAFIPGLRKISISKITCLDSDGSILNSLKAAAYTKAPTAASIVFGNVAGSIVTFTFANLQLGQNNWEENGAALDISFDGNEAHQTSASAADDLILSLT